MAASCVPPRPRTTTRRCSVWLTGWMSGCASGSAACWPTTATALRTRAWPPTPTGSAWKACWPRSPSLSGSARWRCLRTCYAACTRTRPSGSAGAQPSSAPGSFAGTPSAAVSGKPREAMNDLRASSIRQAVDYLEAFVACRLDEPKLDGEDLVLDFDPPLRDKIGTVDDITLWQGRRGGQQPAVRPGGVRPCAAPTIVVPGVCEHADAAARAGRACPDGAHDIGRHTRPNAADLRPCQPVWDV